MLKADDIRSYAALVYGRLRGFVDFVAVGGLSPEAWINLVTSFDTVKVTPAKPIPKSAERIERNFRKYGKWVLLYCKLLKEAPENVLWDIELTTDDYKLLEDAEVSEYVV
jgi:hypothetical protein